MTQTSNAAGALPNHGTETQRLSGAAFLRNAWYVAGWASEFETEVPTRREILAEAVVLFRTRDGRLVALEDRCAHRWAPLSLGRVEDNALRCMYHGVKFNCDGKCIEVPGQDRIADSLRVRAYPVREKYQLAWLWMGDPARADANLIPDLHMLEQPYRRIHHASLDYEAHYSLINDNLLDLSHFSFLHEKTLGRAVSDTRTKPRIPSGSEAKAIDHGVRVEGWLSGASSRTVVIPKGVPDGDLWSRVDFLVPGIYISHAQMFSAGTAASCKGLAPLTELDPLSDFMSIQAVTPTTLRKSHYAYSLGPRTSDMGNAEFSAMCAIVCEAFAEDIRMIEAQQRNIDAYPGIRMGGIAADRGLVLFRNLMRRLIATETATALPADN